MSHRTAEPLRRLRCCMRLLQHAWWTGRTCSWDRVKLAPQHAAAHQGACACQHVPPAQSAPTLVAESCLALGKHALQGPRGPARQAGESSSRASALLMAHQEAMSLPALSAPAFSTRLGHPPLPCWEPDLCHQRGLRFKAPGPRLSPARCTALVQYRYTSLPAIPLTLSGLVSTCSRLPGSGQQQSARMMGALPRAGGRQGRAAPERRPR